MFMKPVTRILSYITPSTICKGNDPGNEEKERTDKGHRQTTNIIISSCYV